MKPRLSFTMTELPQINVDSIASASVVHLDIPYASHPNQIMDIYLPGLGEKPYPVVIYLHSGAFVGGNKRDANVTSVLRALEEGYALVSVEYRSGYEVTWPAQIFDVKTAIRCLRANAAQYGLDPNRFALLGVSAGGYIGTMAAVTADSPGFEDKAMGYPDMDSRVQAVVDWGGACGKLHEMDGQIKANGFGRPNHSEVNSPESIMMGAALSEIPELCNLASPINHITPNVPSFLIQHGINDGTVPIQQSEDLAVAIAAKAGRDRVRFSVYDVPSGHNGAWYETKEMLDEVFAFLKKCFERVSGGN